MRGRSRFSPTRYRRDRLVALDRRVEYLEAERARLERLLALALRVAVGGTSTKPAVLLDVLCELSGENSARAAFIELRESS